MPDNETSVSDSIDLDDFPIDASYTGPRMEVDAEGNPVLTLEFVQAMIQEFKEQRLIHKRYAFQVCLARVRARACVRLC